MDVKRGGDNTKGLITSAKGTGSRRGTLLLCLLMLVGGFSCDRNSQQSEQKPAETPPTVAKLPLPQHGDKAPGAEAPAVSLDKKTSAPATTTAPKAVPVAVVPPVKELPKKVEPKKAEAPVPDGKKKLPSQTVVKDQKAVTTAKPEPRKPSEAGKSLPVHAEKKVVPVAGAEKMAVLMKKPDVKEKSHPDGAVKIKKPAAKPEKIKRMEEDKVSAHGWTVVVGNYLLEDAMAPDLVKVRKAGFDATVKQGVRKLSTMNRLLVAEYADASAAQAELDKLKQHTSDAFVLTHAGKHAVYAGSYLLDSRAASEKERLTAAGFSLTLKRVNVAIPSKMLTAGSFDDRKTAEAAAKKLKQAGLKATMVHK